MKERPILMSTPMVQAILDGRKTQTRRVMNPQPELINGHFISYRHSNWCPHPYKSIVETRCPYGQFGDRLGIKEAHYRYGKWVKNGLTKSGRQKWLFSALTENIKYIENPPEIIRKNSYRKEGWYKRSALFMFKKHIRYWLEIKNIRVERVQKITVKDAVAEGYKYTGWYDDISDGEIEKQARQWYQALWDSLNKKRGFGWEKNPFCWVIEFRKV